jgi:hypothetical protein
VTETSVPESHLRRRALAHRSGGYKWKVLRAGQVLVSLLMNGRSGRWPVLRGKKLYDGRGGLQLFYLRDAGGEKLFAHEEKKLHDGRVVMQLFLLTGATQRKFFTFLSLLLDENPE